MSSESPSLDGKKHVVKYDPNDISHVYFLERDGAYLEVPYRDLSHVAASLNEIQNGTRRLRSEGASPGDEQKLFQAIQKQREVVEHATNKTLKARRQAQHQVMIRGFPAGSKKISVERSLEPESPVDPFPFEIWNE